MALKDDDFLRMLRATFKVEAHEHLQAIASGLLELERSPSADERQHVVDTVYRAAHSLKGAARAVDFTEVESICQSLEDVFAAWRRQAIPAPEVLDQTHHALNAIAAALGVLDAPPREAPVTGRAPELSGPSVSAPASRAVPPSEPAADPVAVSSDGTVRISVAKLDARLVEAEEMLAAKLTTAQRAVDLRQLGRRFEAWRRESATVEPHTRALRQAANRPAHGPAEQAAKVSLTRLLDFLDWSVEQLKSIEGQTAALARTAQQDHHDIGKLVDDLVEDSKKLLLLPFATLASQFPKLMRDLCRDQGKEADLVIRGEEIEIDKRILEEMKDPLVHLLRNAADHGIETPDVRVRCGKSARATITLAASRVNSTKVELLVSDDGAGIDVDKVKASAITRGLLQPDEANHLSDAEARALVFQADVSTSPIITRLSGRGLGLAIVRERADRLGGSVTVESRPGDGTSIRIVLPTTLATFRGIQVEAAGHLFVVPTLHVERVARIPPGMIQTVEGGRPTIAVGGRAVSLVWLAHILGLPALAARDTTADAPIPFVVLGSGDERIALAVDAVLEEQEVLAKHLPSPLVRVRNVAGATVLGSGQVAPILHVTDLLASARTTRVTAAPSGPAATLPAARSVLVAEDSITSRMLIKSILESAGYDVRTAVDGMEAYTLLRAERFDLLVSDVEMPRLNGFDLTARIRADKTLSELPVVLVTALETREDLERGIDVGANAYIIKSSFDQGNLLDAVRRLV